MDENLLRHEFQHEADRHDPKMEHDPKLEENWKNDQYFHLACNISVDSRLGEKGLGKEYRRNEFNRTMGESCTNLYEELWENPPKTWKEIEELAIKLNSIKKSLLSS